MDHLYEFEGLPQIHYTDEFSVPSRWPYHSQTSSSLMPQPSYNRSPILAGIGLHSETDEYDFALIELNDRYVQGLNASPFSTEHLYADRKMSDFAIYPTYDTTLSELHHRQGSPSTDAASPSQSCDTFSASHTDDLYQQYGIDFKGSINSSVEFNQGLFTQGSHAGFSRRSSEIPLGGGCSISLDKIQNFQDTAFEHDHDHSSSELDAECDSEHECHNISLVQRLKALPDTKDEGPSASIKDECIRDSTSEHYDDDEEEDDPEYNPRSAHRSLKSTRTRSTTTRRNSHGRKMSTSSAKSRVSKPKSRKAIVSAPLRPFPCPLAAYGCQSTFTSKNEWKRHVSTQHIKLGFWRCDMCLVTDRHNIIHNDFNRKDLFTQHLRRMHTIHPSSLAIQPAVAALPNASGQTVISDEAILEHQTRCHIPLRSNPPRSSCLFCSRTFTGDGAWEERMEHVGAHFEQERKTAGRFTVPDDWREDLGLQDWLEQEGLIEHKQPTGWHIGDGRPRRHDSIFG